MTPSSQASGRAAEKAHAAADQLLDWLRQQRGGVLDHAGGPTTAAEPVADAAPTEPRTDSAVLEVIAIVAESTPESSPWIDQAGTRQAVPKATPSPADPLLRLPHPDWLHHRLTVIGPAAAVAAFEVAARGAGIIPWQLDLDRMEEDLFHLLAAPPAPQRRSLSVRGARVLARQLRDAASLRHDAATARVGSSRACAFDLHALVPVPPEILRLGPDHPDALAWLWAHWGTTEALRHVALEATPALRSPLPIGTAATRFSFWSADWTPWRALAELAARWPTLRFEVRPTYGVL